MIRLIQQFLKENSLPRTLATLQVVITVSLISVEVLALLPVSLDNGNVRSERVKI